MSKRIIVIGGGIAGLSAGCYCAMNGFDVQIFEMHNIPGGLCTAWKKKGYTFDLCIHWLVGSSPRSSLHRIWEELGLIQGRQFYKYEYYARAVDEKGNEFVAYTDPDRLEDEMLKLAPEDSRLIKSFTGDLRVLSRREMPFESPSLKDLVRMLPVYRLFPKYSMSVQEFSGRITSPVLRKLFTAALQWHEMSLIFVMMTLAWMNNGSASYPIGGSLPLAKSIEERFLRLGGKIRYRTKVSKILVENDTAVGVRLTDGSEHKTDIVISAADGHSTIFEWLDGKYVDDEVRGYYDRLPAFPPIVFVCVGVAADLAKEPNTISYPLENQIRIGNSQHERIKVRNHSFDPTLAPAGKTVLSVVIPTDYEYWDEIGRSKQKYEAEKAHVEEAVINAIAERYPEIRSKIEVVDVATPLTFVRYTGNWHGSYEGWQFTRDTMRLKIKPTLPSLSNFYMAGQWLAPGGGLPGAALSARRTVKLLCEKERIRFKTTIS
jgi:phytoene dehydrogenase-like protein